MVVDDGLIFLCMADEEFGKRQPYAFLEEVGSLTSSLTGSLILRVSGLFYFHVFTNINNNVEKKVVVVHRGRYNNNKCIIVCLTM